MADTVTKYIGNYWSSATPAVWTAGDSQPFQMVRDTGVVCTPLACASDGTTTSVEILVITPTRPGTKLLVVIDSITTYVPTITVAAGNYWCALALGATTVAANTSKGYTFTPARYQTKANSQIVFTITGNGTNSLASTCTYMVIEMPDVNLNVVKAT